MLSITVGGWSLFTFGRDVHFLFPSGKEGVLMVTYTELFQFCLVVIGIVTLVYQVIKKK